MYPYNCPAIISHHYIQDTISYNSIDVSAKLIVIDGETLFLMGNDTAEERIEINSMNIGRIIKQYPKVNKKKLGKLQNMSVDLHIDKSVFVTIHKHYRISFHLRSKVNAEIHCLLEKDIIEDVHGPNIVVVICGCSIKTQQRRYSSL